jgi:hypothetical protein
MKFVRTKRWILIGLFGSLAVTMALAARPRPALVSMLSAGTIRWLATQLALATTPSHDPRHPTTTLVSMLGALDRALGEYGEYMVGTLDVGSVLPR